MKAIASSLPFVWLVAGRNRNALKGNVELVERGSGKSLRHFEIEADDDTFFSAGDTALSLGKTGLSFLPFGMLISSAVDMAQGAANDRAALQKMLTRGFVMLSYRKAFGDRTYGRFSAQRKAAQAASQEGEAVTQSPVPPATLTATVAIN